MGKTFKERPEKYEVAWKKKKPKDTFRKTKGREKENLKKQIDDDTV